MGAGLRKVVSVQDRNDLPFADYRTEKNLSGATSSQLRKQITVPLTVIRLQLDRKPGFDNLGE